MADEFDDLNDRLKKFGYSLQNASPGYVSNTPDGGFQTLHDRGQTYDLAAVREFVEKLEQPDETTGPGHPS